MIFKSKSRSETEKIGFKIGKSLKKGFISLKGPLGAGKTTLIRGLARGLGVKSRIRSPTFTYEIIHKGRVPFYHFDCYRVLKPDALLISELDEAMQKGDGVIAVEWAENISKYLPEERTEICIALVEENERRIIIKSYGQSRNRKNIK